MASLKVHSGSCDNKLEVKVEMIGKIAWRSLGSNLPGQRRESAIKCYWWSHSLSIAAGQGLLSICLTSVPWLYPYSEGYSCSGEPCPTTNSNWIGGALSNALSGISVVRSWVRLRTGLIVFLELNKMPRTKGPASSSGKDLH